jgi:predicted pyridoxine 5'-phosphate oxidase superfamily flavin-nucleotide-binding protein
MPLYRHFKYQCGGVTGSLANGDPAGFVKVLDKHTLAISNRLGNERADTFLNVLENPSFGIIFIMPKRREVVRMAGTASLVRDSNLLGQMALNGKTPRIAMLVHVVLWVASNLSA